VCVCVHAVFQAWRGWRASATEPISTRLVYRAVYGPVHCQTVTE